MHVYCDIRRLKLERAHKLIGLIAEAVNVSGSRWLVYASTASTGEECFLYGKLLTHAQKGACLGVELEVHSTGRLSSFIVIYLFYICDICLQENMWLTVDSKPSYSV